jgi:hypothetical protein
VVPSSRENSVGVFERSTSVDVPPPDAAWCAQWPLGRISWDVAKRTSKTAAITSVSAPTPISMWMGEFAAGLARFIAEESNVGVTRSTPQQNQKGVKTAIAQPVR